MNRFTKVFPFFLSLLVLFVSCEDNGIFFPVYESNASFQVTFDGATFVTSDVNFTVEEEDLLVNAINTSTNEVFTLRVDDFDIDTFSFEGENYVATYAEDASNTANVWTTFSETSSRGTIEITHIDYVYNTISGNFNFIGKNTISGNNKAFLSGSFTDVPKGDFPIGMDVFTAKVNGNSFTNVSLFANPIVIGNQKLISIDANTSTTESINLTLPYNITIGEYNFGDFSNQSFPSAQYLLNGDTFTADGKVTITSHNTTTNDISGTFSFVASSSTTTTSYTITEGEFSISY